MPQGSTYDAEGNLVWKFDICTEFDCNAEHAKKAWNCECNGDFTKSPCIFLGEHEEMNLNHDYPEPK